MLGKEKSKLTVKKFYEKYECGDRVDSEDECCFKIPIGWQAIQFRLGGLTVFLRLEAGFEAEAGQVVEQLQSDYQAGRLRLETGASGGDATSRCAGDTFQQAFDVKGRPLTDLCGHVLTDARGRPNLRRGPGGQLEDIKGRPVTDGMGRNTSDPNFGQNPMIHFKQIVFSGQLYDRLGYPLLGCDGHLLYNKDGQPYLMIDSNGQPLSDMRGNPVYDSNGYPLVPQDDQWLDGCGRALRLYDPQGYPCTDRSGRTLLDINGEPMIKRDKVGRPLYTALGEQLRDCVNNLSGTPEFQPTETVSLEEQATKPSSIELFDSKGRPLVDRNMMPLSDSEGKLLVTVESDGIPILRAEGRSYDKDGIPLHGSLTELVCMDSQVFRLYDKEGFPLNDRNGKTLKNSFQKAMILFDNFGRPIKDYCSRPLFDSCGVEMGEEGFYPGQRLEEDSDRLITVDGWAPLMYNQQGRPLNDSEGYILLKSDGTFPRLRLDVSSVKLQSYDRFGRPIYDLYGKPLYNEKRLLIESMYKECQHEGSPQMDDGELWYNGFGIPMEDFYKRPLWQNGIPLITPEGLPLCHVTLKKELIVQVEDMETDVFLPEDRLKKILSHGQIASGRVTRIPVDLCTLVPGWLIPNSGSRSCRALVRVTDFTGKQIVELLQIKFFN